MTAFAEENARTWQYIGPEGGKVGKIVISPSDSAIVYAVSQGKLLNSTDGGFNWQQVEQAEGIPVYISNLFVSQSNSQVLVVSDTSRPLSLKRSFDGGKHWKPLALDGTPDVGSFFELNSPASNSIRLILRNNANTEQRVAVSEDEGANWIVSPQVIQPTAGYNSIKIAAIDPVTPNILYSHLFDYINGRFPWNSRVTLHKSIDGGASWQNIMPTELSSPVHRIKIHPLNSDRLYSIFFTGEGDSTIRQWHSSSDGGETWQKFIIAQPEIKINDLILDPSNPNFLYANISTLGGAGHSDEIVLAKSEDAGQSWKIIHAGFKYDWNSPYDHLFIDPQNNQTLFLSSDDGILRSDNGGQDWQSSQAGIKFAGGSLIVAQDDPNVMFLSTDNDFDNATVGFDVFRALIKSNDGGVHWQNATPNLPNEPSLCKEFVLNPVNNQEIICSAHTRSYKSIDGGNTWALFKAASLKDITYNSDGSVLYYHVYNLDSGHDIMIKSQEINGIWQDTQLSWAGEDTTNKYVFQVLSVPNNPQIIYLVGSVNRSISVYKSKDNGVHWKRQIGAINALGKLIIHPNYSERLIFQDGKAISVSINGGQGWTAISEALFAQIGTENEVRSIVFNPTNPEGLLLNDTSGFIYESKDLGKNWNLIEDQIPEKNYTINLVELQSTSSDVYAATDNGVFKLAVPAATETEKECLFNWAEKHYSGLFNPAFATTKQYEDYTYRYYNSTNTFLGFYQGKTIHLLRPNISPDIEFVGSIEYYQNLAGCGFL